MTRDKRLLGCLAQIFDEQVGADMSGYEAAQQIIRCLEGDGYVIVPKEPTPEMIAAVLPLTGRHCDPATVRLAEQACFLLEKGTIDIHSRLHRDGIGSAQDVIGDWRAMVATRTLSTSNQTEM